MTLPFAWIAGNIDRFKQLNDAFGHRVGDAVLRIIANLLRRSTRRMVFAART